MHSYTSDAQIVLWWDENAENYNQGDPFIYGRGLQDTSYKFEGYRIWQYKDQNGTDPRNLAVYDIKDSISEIDDYRIINGIQVLVPIILGYN